MRSFFHGSMPKWSRKCRLYVEAGRSIPLAPYARSHQWSPRRNAYTHPSCGHSTNKPLREISPIGSLFCTSPSHVREVGCTCCFAHSRRRTRVWGTPSRLLHSCERRSQTLRRASRTKTQRFPCTFGNPPTRATTTLNRQRWFQNGQWRIQSGCDHQPSVACSPHRRTMQCPFEINVAWCQATLAATA